MAKVYVKLEAGSDRKCFVVETNRSATELDHQAIRPFVRDGVQVTCLRKDGAEKYGWAAGRKSKLFPQCDGFNDATAQPRNAPATRTVVHGG